MATVMQKIRHNLIALSIFGLIAYIAVNVLSDRFMRGYRADLTADGLYTLSDGTRDIVANVPDAVQMTFYFSRSLAAPYPSLLTYGKRVEDLLHAVADGSHGNVRLSVVDPEPYSEMEDGAIAAGLKGVPLPAGETLYMGLKVTNDTDGAGIVPFFMESREKFLEYDIAKLIAGLDTSGKPSLGLLSGLPLQYGAGGPQAMMQGQSKPYVIYEQLNEVFDVTGLQSDFDALPADMDVLMLVHPPKMEAAQLLAIDQFVLAGGKTIVFVDPHAEAANPRGHTVSASDLGPLLGAWGVELTPSKIIGDLDLAQRISMGGHGPDGVKNYILWLNITKDNIDHDDVVTGSIDNLALASVGSLKQIDGATTNLKSLINSSKASMLFDSTRAVGTPDPDGLLNDLKPADQAYIIAARVSGTAATAFPDAVTKLGEMAKATGEINLVIVADSDLFDDRFWVQEQNLLGQRIIMPTSGNASFILGLAEQMAGSTALLNLRGRGISQRPFDLVNEIRREAEAKFQNEEKALKTRLSEVEAQIATLEQSGGEGAAIYSKEQETAVETFRAEMVETRKALREVKRRLRGDIEALETKLILFNVVMVPVLVGLIGFIILLRRRRRGINKSRQ